MQSESSTHMHVDVMNQAQVPMLGALDRVSYAIDELDNVIGRLGNQLNPILTPDLEPSGMARTDEPIPARSELVNAVHERAEKLEEILRYARSLLNRVEI